MKGSIGRRLTAAVMMTAVLGALVNSSAGSDDRQEAIRLVNEARLMFESMTVDPNFSAMRDLLKKADGVFLVPQMLKGAFVVGVSGGSGVLLTRDRNTGKWSGPAFYTVGGASFGLQAGGQASEVVLLSMTQRGVTAFMSNSLKLGGDVGIAAGPAGAGVSAATANLSADILSFSRSKGLYGGVSLDGAVVAVRESLNRAFYGKKVSPTDILVRGTALNPLAEPLVAAVTKAAGK